MSLPVLKKAHLKSLTVLFKLLIHTIPPSMNKPRD